MLPCSSSQFRRIQFEVLPSDKAPERNPMLGAVATNCNAINLSALRGLQRGCPRLTWRLLSCSSLNPLVDGFSLRYRRLRQTLSKTQIPLLALSFGSCEGCESCNEAPLRDFTLSGNRRSGEQPPSLQADERRPGSAGLQENRLSRTGAQQKNRLFLDGLAGWVIRFFRIDAALACASHKRWQAWSRAASMRSWLKAARGSATCRTNACGRRQRPPERPSGPLRCSLVTR